MLTIRNGLITEGFNWFSQLGMHRVSAGTKSVYNTFPYLVTVFVDFWLIFNYSFPQGSSAQMQLGQIEGGLYWNRCSSGSSRRVGGPEKHDIYGAAFIGHLFMTYFYMVGGDMAHRPPPPPTTIRYCCDHKKCNSELKIIVHIKLISYLGVYMQSCSSWCSCWAPDQYSDVTQIPRTSSFFETFRWDCFGRDSFSTRAEINGC